MGERADQQEVAVPGFAGELWMTNVTTLAGMLVAPHSRLRRRRRRRLITFLS